MTMQRMSLSEKHRPATFDAMIGNAKAITQCRRLAENGVGGRAVWISGPSSTGKTTAARILAASIADRSCTVEFDSADQVSQAAIDDMIEMLSLHGWGRGGRAWIINESHSLRAPIIRQLLGILERLPAHCTVIFTTTKIGQEKLFEDQHDSGPLLSRCLQVGFTGQGTAELFAERAREIAQGEGLDGQPISEYLKLIRKHKGNLRGALNDIEAGVMLEPS